MELTSLSQPFALASLALAASLLMSCASTSSTATTAAPAVVGSIAKADWGAVDGKPVHLWTLKNGKGMEAENTDYGPVSYTPLTPPKKKEV